MAHENYSIFNLNGKVEYFSKIENGYPVVEVHEFCCRSDEPKERYVPDVIAEGHTYNPKTQEPDILVRNFSFYCEKHHPSNQVFN